MLHLNSSHTFNSTKKIYYLLFCFRFVTCVYPIGTEDVITCPYNMALATKELINHASCVIPIENRTLLDIISHQGKNKHSLDTMSFIAKSKPFQDMNSIIVNLLLNLTR